MEESGRATWWPRDLGSLEGHKSLCSTARDWRLRGKPKSLSRAVEEMEAGRLLCSMVGKSWM